MPAIAASSAEVVVLADADVWCEGLPEAISAVRDGAPWAVPHHHVKRLTEAATTALLGGEDLPADYTQPPYEGVWGGGITVARRETFLEVPLDPRFVAWGQEDESHGIALHHLAGPGWRGATDLTHLFHPPQERMTRRRGSLESWQLHLRYRRARRDSAALTALVEEAKRALELDHQTLHNHAPDPVG